VKRSGMLTLGLALALSAAALAKPEPYKVGGKVKDFALKDTDGKTVKLSQFKGKVMVLAFSAAF